MNTLLALQLRKHLPHLDPQADSWRPFLDAVGSAYDEAAQDRAFLEHTLEVTSDELTEANDRLRRESESRLASLNRYFRQTLELQQGMILCVRHTERGFEPTLCRGQLAVRLGLPPERVEGRLLEEILPPEYWQRLHPFLVRAWAGEELSFVFTNPEGAELLIMLRPRREGLAVCEVIASCVDVTTMKQAEYELRSAKERAEAADRAKSEFLAVMSHEIRTPLNSVLGFANLLQQTPLTAEQREWLQTICTSGESLLVLLNDILDFSKIEAGRLALSVTPVTLATLLDEMSAMFRPRAQEKNLAFSTLIASDVPPMIETDVQRLRQVLVNLLGNAVKFTARGAVRLLVFAATAPTGSAPNECRLKFAVQDTGIGIPPERRDLLFKPFSQVDSSTTRHYGGTGLGLAICSRLVHLLGGEIDVTSEVGVGSTFSFSIRVNTPTPLAPARDAAPAPVSPPPAPAATTSGFRILVAEDQAQNRELIHQVLKRRGYLADVVENGAEAVEAARRQPYDLILLDLRMPRLDGYSAAEAIRHERGAGPAPKIFALTANVFPEDRARCTRCGMDGILTKPLQFDQLFGTIAAILAERTTPPPA